jgi:hypothetical protein
MERGVTLPCPSMVEVDESLDPARIAPGVVLHSGCRILGSATSIGPGSELGREAPAVVEDCQLGHKVELMGGYFSGATFLDGARMGSAAHVRPATLLEEEAGGAHAVGFKQTIFLPFVTAGSLINFCDALMAGGTSRRDHSEIGSSYIHFNFTPHQDKATPSLIGDVPRGVFLDQAPVFLGGQGGLVGPSRIGYGTVIPAGAICRQDVLEEGQLFIPPPLKPGSRAFASGIYRSIDRIVENNLIYIGNLWALKFWYRYARTRTMSSDSFACACHAGALKRIEDALEERLKRMREFVSKVRTSLERAHMATGRELRPGIRVRQQALMNRWPEMEALLQAGPPLNTGTAVRDSFFMEWDKTVTGAGHIKAVGSLSTSARKWGAAWLQDIVDWAQVLWIKLNPGEE